MELRQPIKMLESIEPSIRNAIVYCFEERKAYDLKNSLEYKGFYTLKLPLKFTIINLRSVQLYRPASMETTTLRTI